MDKKNFIKQIKNNVGQKAKLSYVVPFFGYNGGKYTDIINYLASVGIYAYNFNCYRNVVYIVTDDLAGAEVIISLLYKEIEKKTLSLSSLSEKVNFKLPFINFFGTYEFAERKKSEIAFDKMKIFLDWQEIEEKKLNTSKEAILSLNSDGVLNPILSYLENNFSIQNLTFSSFLKIVISELDNFFLNKSFLDDDILINQKIKYLNDLKYGCEQEETYRNLYRFLKENNNIWFLDSLIKSIESKSDFDNIIIEKNGLKEKLLNYVDFENIEEPSSFIPFNGLYLSRDETDLDFVLSSTSLARDVQEYNHPLLNRIITSIVVHYFFFMKLKQTTLLELELEKFYIDDSSSHIFDKLKTIIENTILMKS